MQCSRPRVIGIIYTCRVQSSVPSLLRNGHIFWKFRLYLEASASCTCNQSTYTDGQKSRRDRIFNFSFAQLNFYRPNFCWEKFGRSAQRSSLSKLCGSSVYQVREAETQHQLSLQEIIDDINISPMEDMRIDEDGMKTNEV